MSIDLVELPRHSPTRERKAEPPRPVGDIPEEYTDNIRILGAAILRSAVADLGDRRYRAEAERFLTVEFWDEDSLWREIIGDLPREAVLREIGDRLATGRTKRYPRKYRPLGDI